MAETEKKFMQAMDKTANLKNNFILMSLKTSKYLKVKLEHLIMQNSSQRIACFYEDTAGKLQRYNFLLNN